MSKNEDNCVKDNFPNWEIPNPKSQDGQDIYEYIPHLAGDNVELKSNEWVQHLWLYVRPFQYQKISIRKSEKL